MSETFSIYLGSYGKRERERERETYEVPAVVR